jgi:AcrR family transcriptional regulator
MASDQEHAPRRRPVMQARALATRSKILGHAARAFAASGYDATSLTGDILDPATVSVGSFYHQFENKLDVLLTLLRERGADRRESLETALASVPRSDLTSRLHAVVSWLLDDIDAHGAVCTIELRERWHSDPQIREAVYEAWAPWREAIEIALDDGDGLSPDDVLTAQLLGRSLIGTLGTYLAMTPAERTIWRSAELPRLVGFCEAGIESVQQVS